MNQSIAFAFFVIRLQLNFVKQNSLDQYHKNLTPAKVIASLVEIHE